MPEPSEESRRREPPHTVAPDPALDHGELIRDARRSATRVGVGALILLALVAAAVAVLISLTLPQGVAQSISTAEDGRVPAATATPVPALGGVDPAGSDPASSDPVSSEHPASAGVAGGGVQIFVHIVGAIKKPGLVTLAQGSRLVDAVAAAGGFGPKADPAQVNLARVLADGEQIVVPRKGSSPAPDPSSGIPEEGSGAGAPDQGSGGQPLNLNTATTLELEDLPGIGPALASRILEWRENNGSFTSVEDLLAVAGIGDKVLAGLAGLVTV